MRMNKFSQEILVRFGQKMLSLVEKDFPKGFHIVGGDADTLVVGDKVMNRSYCRKKISVKETHRF
jgi:hypothetical protein